MARHNIQFKGMRHAPSDITGQDGDLLECVNLVHEGGELKPIEMPEKTQIKGVYKDPKTGYSYQGVLAAVHNLTDGKKFVFVRILYNGSNTISNLFVNIEGSQDSIYEHTCMGEILWVETIGNTLIVGTNRSTHYVLYKNGAYKWLGDKLPQPVFRVDLSRNNVSYEGTCINEDDPQPYTLTPEGNTIEGGGIALTLDNVHGSSAASQAFDATLSDTTNENKKIFRDGIRSRIATVINLSKKYNKFIFPFFFRYAVRMYDGNYAMHSSPILIIPSSLVNPLLSYITLRESTETEGLVVHGHDGDKYYQVADEAMQARPMGLNYTFYGWYDSEGNIINNVSDWEDIIKGVDLFLSSQIYSYDERIWDDLNNVPTKFKTFPEYVHSGWDVDGFYGHCYTNNQRIKYWDIYTNNNSLKFDYTKKLYKIKSSAAAPSEYLLGFFCRYRIDLPSISARLMMEKIKETHLFYRVKQYDMEELSQMFGWTAFDEEVEQGTLERLETLPILPDDYVSRCRMTGKVNYNYNQRLVLGNIKLQAPKWYPNVNDYYSNIFSLRACFEIEKQEKTIYVRYEHMITNNSGLGEKDFGHYIYYPDPDCKRVVVEITNNKGVVVATKEIPMHGHTGLNGAFALMPNLQSLFESYSTFQDGILLDESDRYYQLPNTVAMSTVANPFHFPASNFKDIGRTKVLGIAANVLDVSSGQWGQYPLHIFCSDGIIAIAIDAEGKMGRIDAVSADVLKEPRGISQPTLIQTNQMLVFLTQRGVMSISGTRPQPLSLVMDGRHFNPMSELADVDYHVGAFANLISRTSDSTAFRDFVASGFLAYDYAHHRVLLLRPDRDYQYVLSLDTMMWSKQIVYTNLASFQLEVTPSNELPAQRSVPLLQVKPIHAAVNNYTEMYLQDTEGWLYKTMDVMDENNLKQLYQYGYFVSRPVRFGTDEYKSVIRVIHEYTHFANKSFVKLALYGSRDGRKYGRINTLRGMGYKYFIFVVYTYLKPNERYSYMSVEFEPRLTNKLR